MSGHKWPIYKSITGIILWPGIQKCRSSTHWWNQINSQVSTFSSRWNMNWWNNLSRKKNSRYYKIPKYFKEWFRMNVQGLKMKGSYGTGKIILFLFSFEFPTLELLCTKFKRTAIKINFSAPYPIIYNPGMYCYYYFFVKFMCVCKICTIFLKGD